MMPWLRFSAKEMPKNHTDKERFWAASSCNETGILTSLFSRKRRRFSPSPLSATARTWPKPTGSKNIKMITKAYDRDVNKSRPCSRRTRWKAFSRCQQTVSISTYFNYKNTVNLQFFFVYRKFFLPGCIRYVFFLSFVARLTQTSEQSQLSWPQNPNRSEYILALFIQWITAKKQMMICCITLSHPRGSPLTSKIVWR